MPRINRNKESTSTSNRFEELKREIDAMDYETLLRHWRNDVGGSPYFQGEVGKYYANRMAEKRAEVGEVAHTTISKRIGWL